MVTKNLVGKIDYFSVMTSGGRGYYLSKNLCCATVLLSNFSNQTPIEDIKELVELIKQEAVSVNGPTNIIVHTHEYEDILAKNLKEVGFIELSNKVTRRKVYDKTKLTMFICSF